MSEFIEVIIDWFYFAITFLTFFSVYGFFFRNNYIKQHSKEPYDSEIYSTKFWIGSITVSVVVAVILTIIQSR